jgi:hypothetical protein
MMHRLALRTAPFAAGRIFLLVRNMMVRAVPAA